MSRRPLVLGGAAAAVANAAAAQVYRARHVNPFRPRLERVVLTVPAAHAGLAGLRIGFVSDTHVGPFTAPADIARATAILAAERPDLILLGGDYISESPRYAEAAVAVLGELVREAPLGGFAVLGNHDHTIGEARVTRALEREGIVVLKNAARSVTFNGAELWIAGIDDTLLGMDDPAATFAQIPTAAAVLALWHEPIFAEVTAEYGAFAQLSGHTHGGQIRIPGLGPIGLPAHGKRHVMGHNRADGMPVYTSRGVGVYRPPIRINCPPEVTLITLVAP